VWNDILSTNNIQPKTHIPTKGIMINEKKTKNWINAGLLTGFQYEEEASRYRKRVSPS